MTNQRQKLFAKIFLIVLIILLMFSIIVLISYENSYKRNTILIDNGHILNRTNQGPLIDPAPEETNHNIFQKISNVFKPDEVEEPTETIVETTTHTEGDLSISINPIEDQTLKGLISIEIHEYPELSEEILIMISPKYTEDPINNEQSLIEFIDYPFDAEFVFDSEEFDNGEYELRIAATYENAPEQNPWLEVINIDILIIN